MGILYFVAGVFCGVLLVLVTEAVNQALDRYLDGGEK